MVIGGHLWEFIFVLPIAFYFCIVFGLYQIPAFEI